MATFGLVGTTCEIAVAPDFSFLDSAELLIRFVFRHLIRKAELCTGRYGAELRNENSCVFAH